MSDSEFAYSAPQYYDFTSFQEDNVVEVEQYFEIDHECNQQQGVEDMIYVIEDDQIFYSFSVDDNDKSNGKPSGKLRKSMSTGNLLTVWQSKANGLDESNSYENVNQNTNNFIGPENNKLTRKLTSSSQFSVKSQNKPRKTASFASQEWLNRLAQPKQDNSAQSSRFISLAEAVQKFHKKTPERFHSKQNINISQSSSVGVEHHLPKAPTIAKSPALSTKHRSRSANLPTREEKELMEFEEAQKNKFTAHPVNKKIFKSPLPITTFQKKPLTVPVPFNLSYANKGESTTNTTDTNNFIFHANPIPKGLFENNEKPIIKKATLTKPKTPVLVKRYKAQMEERLRVRLAKERDAQSSSSKGTKSDNLSVPSRSTDVNFNARRQGSIDSKKKEDCDEKGGKKCTEIRPFSFDERDKMKLKKKEIVIKKLMEEEEKMKEFHATPIPQNIYGAKRPSFGSLSKMVTKALNNTRPADITQAQFKATPATVLQTKPFIPKKEAKPLTEIPHFELNSDRRARERNAYNEKLKQRDEIIENEKKRMEQERIRLEEKEKADFRRMIEYKAQPIRKYKPIEPVTQKSLTEPKSPNFHFKKICNDKNKENISK